MMQNEFPLVTIRVPAYNHEDYIKELLDSIGKDDYPNKELVIIDDGSTDKTPLIIEEWIKHNSHRFPVKYKSRPNKGITATINELLDMAEGEFVTGIASDDVLVDGGISSRVYYLMNHPEKSAVFSDCSVIGKSGEILFKSGLSEFYHARKERYTNDDGLKKEIILNWAVLGPSLMVRRSIYKEIGHYDESLVVEDWDFYLRMVASGKLGFLDTIVAKYRRHGENLSAVDRFKLKMIRDRLKTARKNIHLFGYPYNFFLILEMGYLYLFGFYRLMKYWLKK